jgi:hypothetical protein
MSRGGYKPDPRMRAGLQSPQRRHRSFSFSPWGVFIATTASGAQPLRWVSASVDCGLAAADFTFGGRAL